MKDCEALHFSLKSAIVFAVKWHVAFFGEWTGVT